VRWIKLLAALALASATPAFANPKNALDAYVAKPDPSFSWKVDHPISGPGYHGAVLALASQTWLDARQVDKPVWRHWLTVIVLDGVAHDKGFLYITGGDNTDPAPKQGPGPFAAEVSVISDGLPYRWKDARPITAPDGR
jgi:hypothetical protein